MQTQRIFWVSLSFAGLVLAALFFQLARITDQWPLLAPVERTLGTEKTSASNQTTQVSAPEAGPDTGVQKVSRAVGLNLRDARTALERKDFARAFSYLTNADALPNKTNYDLLKIQEFWAYYFAVQKLYAKALPKYELLASNSEFRPFQTEAEVEAYRKLVIQLAATAADHEKTVLYAQRWLIGHPNDVDVIAMMGSAFYGSKSYTKCSDTFASAISNVIASGGTPQESWLLLQFNCASNIPDTRGALAALNQLCRYYPTPKNWHLYVQRASRNDRYELPSFYWLELAIDTAPALSEPDDFINFAQRAASTYRLPTTGATAIEQGLALHKLDTPELRHARTLSTLSRLTEAARNDQSRISDLLRDASIDTTGQAQFDLGRIYFDQGQFAQAIDSLTVALEKNKFTDADQAQMTLGIAYLKNGNKDRARDSFKPLLSNSELKPVVSAWITRTYN